MNIAIDFVLCAAAAVFHEFEFHSLSRRKEAHGESIDALRDEAPQLEAFGRSSWMGFLRAGHTALDSSKHMSAELMR